MNNSVYVPARGLSGKLKRLRGRVLARHPMTVAPDRPIVSIAFDDFPRSAATTAKDLVERHGWRATYYASGCFAETTTHLGQMYSWDDLRGLHRDGHEIGCHTYSHLDAGRCDSSQIETDVARNARTLADMAGVEQLATFAFPYGEASPAAKRCLIGRFHALRSVKPGINADGADRALLNAVGIEGGEAGIARAVQYAGQIAEKPGWLILFTHEVTNEPSQWGCTPADFARVLDAVERSGARVLPVREALELLSAQENSRRATTGHGAAKRDGSPGNLTGSEVGRHV